MMILDRTQQFFSYGIETIQQAAASTGSAIQQTVRTTLLPAMGSTMQSVVEKTNALWQQALALLQPVISFLGTNLGISTGALAGAAIAAIIAKREQHQATAIASMVASVTFAAISGFYLAQSGVIPAVITDRFLLPC